MIRVNQIKVPIKYNEELLHNKVAAIIGSQRFKISGLVKKSIDARDKNSLMYILSVDINADDEVRILRKNINNKNIMLTKEESYTFPCQNQSVLNCKDDSSDKIIIVGAGPAGYFCALYLARNGYRPVVLERGKCVEERSRDVDDFWSGAEINQNSNVSFGEGGAGTFSDGKLNTGIKDKAGRIRAIINDFISFGAGAEIGYSNKPHVGTDVLKTVMRNMREEIISLGGEIHFNSRFSDYRYDGDKLLVLYEDISSGETHTINAAALVLAIGHSSRDTFELLNEKRLPMEPKAFAMGLRIEHKRELINSSQYGKSKEAALLPAADYKMTYRSSEGRSVYSFCMCPGGYVVNASSDKNQSVVNGMSYHDRDAENSNSAIVVNVTAEDFIREGFGEHGVLAGVEFQKKYEALAYTEGRGRIPVSTLRDYRDNKTCEGLGNIKPCIKGDFTLANLNNCLPEYINNAIIEGILYYDERLEGFASDDAVLSGIESRTSSPVRIIRDDNFMSESKGIFPCGEGAGYAGGITSAAVDGIKVAEAVAAYINHRH